MGTKVKDLVSDTDKTGRHEILFDDTTHTYLVDGEQVPSVTTIIKNILPDTYKGVSKRVLEKASVFGTKLHKATEIGSNKDLTTVLENMTYQEYCRLLMKEDVKPERQEVFVCYENPNYPDNGLPKILWVGQTDMIGYVKGKRCLLDKKFTSQYHEEYLEWQLSMYELACYEMFEGLYCIHVPKKGIGHLYQVNRKSEEEILEQVSRYYLKDKEVKVEKGSKKMAKKILIMGEPASGKTTSLIHYEPLGIKGLNCDETYWIDCDKKGLNYPNWEKDYNDEKKNYYACDDAQKITDILRGISDIRNDIHYVVIDTINSVMEADEMRRSKEKGFDKWQDLAKCIYDIIDTVPSLRNDLTIILVGHIQEDEDTHFIRLKTNGKKLDKMQLEKYFNIVLLAKCVDGEYFFETRSNNSTARTPLGAFKDLQIKSDMADVLEVLKEY